jgi:hypothetical protein
MTDHLHQLNINYVPVEDRLMLRINTQAGDEFRLWLTRRYTGLLLDLLTKEIDKHGGVPTLASTTETKNLFKQGAMEKRYEEEKITNYPLGETGFLASKINYKSGAKGVLTLEMLPEKGQGITLNLNKTLLFMFYNLLTQGCSQSAWGLPGQQNPADQKVH